jgi:hypothetical protein
MNQRIRELADESAKYSAIMALPTGQSGNELFVEKFAELIVRECADIGDNYQDILGNEPECFNCRKVAYGIVDKIKEHFGVEE